MAKQKGTVKIRGCYDNLCFYQMGGEYYVRMKSSLEGKRVKKDPAFALTMRYAGWMGRASKIASRVYGELPNAKREHRLYRKLTGEAMQLLKSGKSAEEITEILRESLNAEVQIAETEKISRKRKSYAETVIKNVFTEAEAKVEVKAEVKDEAEAVVRKMSHYDAEPP